MPDYDSCPECGSLEVIVDETITAFYTLCLKCNFLEKINLVKEIEQPERKPTVLKTGKKKIVTISTNGTNDNSKKRHRRYNNDSQRKPRKH